MKGMSKDIRGVLLDFGGTIVEELPDDMDSVLLNLFIGRGLVRGNRPMKRENFSRTYWLEHYASLPRGKRWTIEIRTDCNLALMNHLGLVGERERVASETAEMDNWFNIRSTFPDVLPTLKTLREMGFKLGVVSQSLHTSEELGEELVARGIAGFFDVVVTSESTGIDKPDPGIYLDAISRLKTRAEETCHVGDNMEKDANGAIGAGLIGILIDRNSKAEAPQGVIVIRSLTELPGLVRSKAIR
jgi:putative hydrolase of the HAD superfamily